MEKRTAGELVTSIRAGTPPPDSDVADARREVAEAQERIEASRAILPTLDEACRESESAAIAAEARLACFADAVITAEVPLHEMFSEIERMQVALNEKRLALRFLVFKNLIPPGDQLKMAEKILLHNTIVGGYGSVEFASFDNDPAWLAWTAVREKLKSDHDASLPTG